MQRAIILSFALVGGASAADLRGAKNNARGLLAADMRPEVVAESFAHVEDEWRSQALEFAECHGTANATSTNDCSSPAEAFGKSCSLVAKSMIDGSSGDGGVVTEYMSYVCNSSALVGWKQDGCFSFAKAMSVAMTDDKYDNRENLNITSLCGRFWQKFSMDEEKRIEKERAEREAEEKKRAEEAAAAAKKAAEEAAKVEEEQQKAEQAKKTEEARQQAEEAKLKAEEAARSLEEKKQEAEKQEAEANRTKAEARLAAEVNVHMANRTNGTIGSNVTTNKSANSTPTTPSATSSGAANSTSK